MTVIVEHVPGCNGWPCMCGKAPVDVPPAAAPMQYIVLHQSVRNHPGVCAAQAAHAAAESLRVAPLTDRCRVCVLVADTSADLEMLAEKLTIAGIHHVLIHEPDPPYAGAATALGTEPQAKELVAPYMTDFKLLR